MQQEGFKDGDQRPGPSGKERGCSPAGGQLGEPCVGILVEVMAGQGPGSEAQLARSTPFG